MRRDKDTEKEKENEQEEKEGKVLTGVLEGVDLHVHQWK